MEPNRFRTPFTGTFARPALSNREQRLGVVQQLTKAPETIPPCTFILNGKPMSTFNCNGALYNAFSGLNNKINKRDYVCEAGEGAIPPGTYFIVERQTGGRLGWLYDAFGGQDEWFALYANDGSIDDQTFCNKVRRGEFRLHPKGPRGISQGCITIERKVDFMAIRNTLINAKRIPIPALPGTLAFGTVIVK